jgi:PAS domain S-box-containing protein
MLKVPSNDRDIAACNGAADELRRNEAFLAEGQRLSKTGSFGWKVSTGELFWSAETYRIYQYDPTMKPTIEMVMRRVHPEEVHLVEQTCQRAARDGKDYFHKFRVVMPDGSLKHIHIVAHSSRDTFGNLEYVGAVMDITQQKQYQETVERQKAHLDQLFELAPDAITLSNNNDLVLRINREFEILSGYTTEEVVGRSLGELILPDDTWAECDRNKSLLLSGAKVDVETVLKRKNGELLIVSLVAARVSLPDGEFGAYTVYRDITARNKAADELRRKEDFLTEGQRLSKTGSYGWKVATGELFWSEETYRIYEYDPSMKPIIPMVYQRVHPEDLPAMEQVCKRAKQEGKDYTHKFRALMPDGSLKHIHIVAHSSRDTFGNLEYVGSVMDVTEQHKAKAALEAAISEIKKSEGHLRASELVARGQVNALTRTLDAIAMESLPDRLVEHVLRTIADEFNAHSSSVWRMDEASGLPSFEFALEGRQVMTKSTPEFLRVKPSLPIQFFWPSPEDFRAGKPGILEDISKIPAFPWRDYLMSQGIVTVLCVPMVIAGEVKGITGIRFTSKRTFRTEEIELAKALANQSMLSMELTRLSGQSRQSAVIAERNRMARDIHDTLAQGFTGVIVHLEAASEATSKGLTQKSADHLAQAEGLARESLAEARRSVRALRPLALEGKNLCEALEDLFTKMTKDTPLRSEFVFLGTQRNLPDSWEENILRIGLEMLTNALRHAQATLFRAQITFAPTEVLLDFRDDGCGFAHGIENNGFGLQGIKERIESMSGQLAVESAKGQGTLIKIVLPI